MIVEEQEQDGNNIDDLDNELAQVEEANLPDKFKGKSAEEIAASYENLEKELGRKNNEIGDLRKYTDQLLQLNTEEKAPEEEVDFFDDPQKAVEQTVSPRIEKLEKQLEDQARRDNQRAFETKHPDFMEVVQSNDFADWVRSSQYRSKQFQQANNFDYDAGDDLLTEWKERKAAMEQVDEKKKVKRDNDLKAASSESNSTSGSSRKIYRRSDIVKMKIEDPDKYNARMPEIMKAYAEGRVR